ncbi:reverse transcriptase-like protein [Nitzschia inconspicua]|uniref:Reverse transcriptase-like protein n=1 Tax=Nitzschia inconspicua TaxID=303405 RepID=A0A9K3KW90_9STRA|nr:reverse transcriptase-like protein [Nitzschia inconspicua]
MISVLSLASPSLLPPQQPQPLHSQQQIIVPRTIIISLQFDGSYRPPKDFGHATIPRRFAVAAACVSLDTTTTIGTTTTTTCTRNKDTNSKVQPMAVVAARILPTVPFEMTSQHAEYEGLLLGLRHVNDQWQKWVNCNGNQQNEHQIQNHHHQVAYTTTSSSNNREQQQGHDSIETKSKCHQLIILRIQGDCKTVIDQLSGKSVPRKLERLWKEAQDQIERIQQQQESHTDDSLVMEYKLLPRNENKICDNVCNNLMSIMSNNVWTECITTLENTNFEGIVETNTNTNTIPRDDRNLIDQFWTTYLDPSNSIIRYSLRPLLYIKLATLATEHNHHESLIQLGETLWNEARMYCPHKNGPSIDRNESSLPYNIALRKFSIECQINGWMGLGNQKMVSSLQRKHRRLLSMEVVDAVGTVVTPSHAWDYETLRRHGEIKEDWEDGIPQEWREMLHQWFQLARTTNVVVLDTKHNNNNNKDPLRRWTDCDEEQDDIIIVLSEIKLDKEN